MRRSCCFTGAYTKFCEGTGSVLRLTPLEPEEEASRCEAAVRDGVSWEYRGAWDQLRLRYFTPREVLPPKARSRSPTLDRQDIYQIIVLQN